MNRIETLAAELEALRTEIAELGDVEDINDEQLARLDELIPLAEAKREELETAKSREQRMDAIVRSVAEGTTERGAYEAPQVVVKRSPFENMDSVRAGLVGPDEVRARALTAIETVREDVPDAYREQATRLAQRSAGIAQHILLTGSPAYRSGFDKYLRHGDAGLAMMDREEADALVSARAALSTTAANGGYLIPFLLDSSIVLTSDGSANPFRQISRIETGTSNKWNGVSSAGVSAEWKAEGSAAADASPTFGQPSITAYLADAYVLGSYEAFMDTDIASQLPMLVQEAKDDLEASAFATGDGSGKPTGIVTAVTAVTASRVSPTTGGTFSAASEVYKVINAVPPRHRSRSSWVANYSTLNAIRAFDVYGGSSFWADLSADTPPRLLGRPVYESSAMTATVTTGSNILLAGNFADYLIYDRVGTSLEMIPNVVDTSTGRPTGQRGYIAWWRTGAGVLSANSFRVLKL